MEENRVTEKVYCYDHPSAYNHDNSAMLAALLNKNDNPLEAAALMNGGMGGQWNNPFIYLVWMMFAQRMWGNGWDNNGQNAQNVELQNQIQSLRSQISDNQNSNLVMDAIKGNAAAINQLASNMNCDFNTLNSAICDVRGGIDKLSGQVGFSSERVINSIVTGNLQLTQALKDCCCQTQQNIIKMGYDNQLGQKDIINQMQQGFSYTNTGLERGFSNVSNLIQSVACDLKTNENYNTQRIIDTLTANRYADLQERLEDAKRREQTTSIVAQLKSTTTTTPTT
nr:MAG TPA: hypothetical protein [Caudoviricetes sp.]